MVKCSKCGHNHHASYHLKDKLTDKGFPTHSKKYASAHEQADKAEKKKFPRKDYVAMQKVDAKLPKGQLAGKNLKNGKIEVSRKVPAKLRREVQYHEKVESKQLLRKKR
jgi:hypothetical protein